MKKIVLPAVLLAAALLLWLVSSKGNAPAVPFTRVTRQTISNTLSTNGKAEPLDFVDVRVETPGLVKRLLVHAGDTVRAGQAVAELGQPGLGEDLAAAEARAAQAKAELETLQGGGRGADVAELEGNASRLKAQRDAAERALESSQRLLQANATTRYEVDQARQAVNDLDVQIQSLNRRKTSLVGQNDVRGARAHLNEAEANVRLARSRIGQNTIRTPLGGTVYSLPARLGAYLNAGEAVASVGKLDPLRVRVYVDEPELGRVQPGEQVRITWDALPGREWTGSVEKRPAQVIALGSRQVGEVLCTIANPNRELVPGTNVNAFILTKVVARALTIPKTAVRRESGIGVYVLGPDQVLQWRAIRTGVSDALRVEVVSGVSEGEMVAQPSEQTLRDGMKVRAR